jgi:lipoyl(octanoyl) transferase
MAAPPLVRHLGRVDYEPTWRRMQAFTEARGADQPDELWFLEHPPVFTLGLNGSREHLLAPGDIPVVQVDRGGQVTYHGPGQLVVYPLLDLGRSGLGVRAAGVRARARRHSLRRRLRHHGGRQPGGPGRLRRRAQAREHRPQDPAQLQLPRPGAERGHGPRAVPQDQSLRVPGPGSDPARDARRAADLASVAADLEAALLEELDQASPSLERSA